MAQRAFFTNNYRALNVMYNVQTEEFEGSRATYDGFDSWDYKVDLVVDTRPECLDIPLSVWTVTLSVDLDGDVTEEVKAKSGPESLTNPSLVLTDWSISRGWWDSGFENDNSSAVGSDFRPRVRRSLRSLLVGAKNADTRDFPQYRRQYGLVPGLYVVINLTFMVENTTCPVLSTLYESTLLADCKLVCGGREFSAHRAILAAQSPVFAAMFQSEMKEKSLEVFTVKDIHPDMLDGLLQFAYTKQLTKANGNLQLLWNAADKYSMQEVKQECDRLMVEAGSDDNASEDLYFAQQRGPKKMKVGAAETSQEPV